MTYRFGDFTLDPRTRRLLRGAAEIHLSPKAFELLRLLIENHAQAMSKADLHQALWPSTFVQDTNLASLVAEIRRALDDPADEPRYIRTLHRFGYRFIDALQKEEAPAPAPRVRCWLVSDGRQIALEEGENVLGRAPDASIWIDAAGVSRHHARIVLDGTSATLEDLDSKNGTYVGGERISAPYTLKEGDRIRLGSVLMTFRIPPPAASTETVRG